jgi:hypothetical protein
MRTASRLRFWRRFLQCGARHMPPYKSEDVQMLSSRTLAIRFAALPCGFLIRPEMMFVPSM